MRTVVVRRDAAVQVRVARRELERWRAAAAGADLTVSEYVRAAVRACLTEDMRGAVRRGEARCAPSATE